MQHGPARAVEPLSLAGQSSAVLLVVDQDVKHGAALLIALSQTALQHLYVRAQSALDPHGRARILYHGLRHRDQARPSLSPPPCFCRFSSSFSRAIIFSSRPTTTSSNFSRSTIFSCSSLLDFSRSRTTCSYARMSRRMPIAPMTLPSASRRAEALRVVGITSPLALRGLRRALRVTPRSTTSRSAAVNSRVSSRSEEHRLN